MRLNSAAFRHVGSTLRSIFFLLFIASPWATANTTLPAGLSRFNPAGLPSSWEYEGEAFSALRSATTSLKSVPVMRLHHPQRGFFLTISEVEANQAEAAGFVRQGVAFHVPASSTLQVHRFISPASGSYFYSTDRNAAPNGTWSYQGVVFHAYAAHHDRGAEVNVPRSGSTRIAKVARYSHVESQQYLFTAGRETPYQVGAFYFGAFSPSAKRQSEGTARVYGRQGDWWGGVSDFYGQQPGIPENTRGWSGSWPHLKPAIGYYNQQAVETLAKQIRQASDAGFSFFSFYWYWSNTQNRELFPEALKAFLLANSEGRLKFNLAFYAPPWEDDIVINSANLATVVDTIVGYFSQPAYLRLPDGRPVFVMGNPENIRLPADEKCSERTCNEKAMDMFLATLKKVSAEKLDVVPFVQIQIGATGWNRAPQVDGITCLFPPTKVQGATPYPSLTTAVFAPLANARKPASPCMFQNFDERPRQDVLVKNRAVIRYFVGKTDSALRHNMEVAKQFSDSSYAATKNPVTRIVYLYAWNEWHEGGILEPNIATGAEDLNIVTDVFQLPRSPSACLDQGAC